jgi:hypothetical protein
MHNEALTVIAVCIGNEDRSSVGINRCDAAPTPAGFAEIVSGDFPVSCSAAQTVNLYRRALSLSIAPKTRGTVKQRFRGFS